MPIRDAIKTFNANAESVYGLIDFDRAVLELATSGLEELGESLANQGSNNAARLVANRVTSFKNVRSNDSLRPRYETIYNQCVVLLVSYFGAAVHTVFSQAIGTAYARAQAVPAADLEIKVRWRDLPRDGQPLGEVLADLIVAQRDISFQDMQSITRAFSEQLGVKLDRDAMTNDIILGQACRHAIAHAGTVVDARMLRQLRAATPRSLKPEVAEGDRISFSPDEVRALGRKMSEYLDRICTCVEATHGPSSPAV